MQDKLRDKPKNHPIPSTLQYTWAQTTDREVETEYYLQRCEGRRWSPNFETDRNFVGHWTMGY